MNLKTYSELTFTDDFMFCKVMSTRLDLCKELLELILGIKIREILIPEQRTNQQAYVGGGFRLNVYIEDDQETVYDIEMQVDTQKDLPKRSRYYQGMIDYSHIKQSDLVHTLKKTFVIFICLSDPFGRNLPIYTFENRCREDVTLSLGDETCKVFVNAEGCRDQLSPEMAAFLDYLSAQKTQSTLTTAIQAEVDASLRVRRWMTPYLNMRLRIQEEREEAKAFGVEKGRSEVRAEGILRSMASFVRDGLIDLATAADRLNMTIEEFQKATASL